MLVGGLTESQFSYCPLIWMLHEKALRILYENYNPKFDELLENDDFFSVHHRNIQTLDIEIFKFLNGLSPQIMNEVFQVKSPVLYYLRDKNDLYSGNPETVWNGVNLVYDDT